MIYHTGVSGVEDPSKTIRKYIQFKCFDCSNSL